MQSVYGEKSYKKKLNVAVTYIANIYGCTYLESLINKTEIVYIVSIYIYEGAVTLSDFLIFNEKLPRIFQDNYL